MFKDWQDLATQLSGDLRALRAGAPDVMKGFSALAQAALKANALDTKTKELIALAISWQHAVMAASPSMRKPP